MQHTQLEQDLSQLVLKVLRRLPKNDDNGELRLKVSLFLNRHGLASPLRSVATADAIKQHLDADQTMLETAIALYEHCDDVSTLALERLILKGGGVPEDAPDGLRGPITWEDATDEVRQTTLENAVVTVRHWLSLQPKPTIVGLAIRQTNCIHWSKDPRTYADLEYACSARLRDDPTSVRGFMLDTLQFVTAADAVQIAIDSGQIAYNLCDLTELLPEHLWS